MCFKKLYSQCIWIIQYMYWLEGDNFKESTKKIPKRRTFIRYYWKIVDRDLLYNFSRIKLQTCQKVFSASGLPNVHIRKEEHGMISTVVDGFEGSDINLQDNVVTALCSYGIPQPRYVKWIGNLFCVLEYVLDFAITTKLNSRQESHQYVMRKTRRTAMSADWIAFKTFYRSCTAILAASKSVLQICFIIDKLSDELWREYLVRGSPYSIQKLRKADTAECNPSAVKSGAAKLISCLAPEKNWNCGNMNF